MNQITNGRAFNFLRRKKIEYRVFSGLFFFQTDNGLPYCQAFNLTFSEEPKHRIMQMIALLAVVVSVSFLNSLLRNVVRLIRQDRAAQQKKKRLKNKKEKGNSSNGNGPMPSS